MRRAVGACAGVAVVIMLLVLPGAGLSGSTPFSPRHGHISGIVPRRIGAKPLTTPLGSGNLVYHDGLVMRTNTTYAIYWLPSTWSFNGDSSGYESLIDQYFTDVAHDSGLSTNVYSADPQYYDTVGGGTHAAAYDSTFGGSIVVTDPYPTNGCNDGVDSVCLIDSQLQAEIKSVVEAQGWPENDATEYFLFTPNGVGGCFDGTNVDCTTNSYCGYHNAFSGTTGDIIYADEPWNAIPGCDTGEHPNNSDADPTINVVSHEHNEAVTDPINGGGWWDNAGYEIGDKCGNVYGAASGSAGHEYDQTINGHHYYLQEEYSNAAGDCVAGTPVAAPSVTSFAPVAGDPGGDVTITGSGFTAPASVSFGGNDSSSVTVDSSTQITASVPDGATTGKISVTDAGGTGASSTNFTVRTITSFSPGAGKPATKVTIHGAGFTDVTSVTFGGTDAQSFTVVSDAQISATVATGTTTGPVAVTGPGGTATSSGNFSIAPTISTVTPSVAPVGATLDVDGTSFTGASAVKIGGVAQTYNVVSDSLIHVDVGATTKSGKVSVVGPGGMALSPQTFTLEAITAFAPTKIKPGGTVTILGSGFTGATDVSVGGLSVQGFDVVSPTKITAVLAPGSTTGQIAVTTPAGVATSAKSLALIPRIANFTPLRGPVTTSVVITGSGFDGATAVRFGAKNAQTFHVDSDTQITAVVDAGTKSGKVTVVAPGGTATSSTSFTVVAITSFTPVKGGTGTRVTIVGSGFSGATAVTFDGVNAQSFTVVSATKITAVVAGGTTTGPVAVVTPDGTATSTAGFTVP